MNVQPLFLGESQTLFGMRELPEQAHGDVGVVILNAGVLHSAGPFRLHVTLSNRLAKLGFPIVRIDQSGKGESPRRPGLDRASTVLQDYDDVFAELARAGVARVVLIGLCWGADDAVYIGSKRDSVEGIVALDGFAYRNAAFYARHYLKRSISPAAWVRLIKKMLHRSARVATEADELASVNDLALRDWAEHSEMVRRYETLLNRGVRLLGVYTQGQNYYNHVGQLASNLPNGDRGCLREVFFDDTDHTFSLTAHRERLIDLVETWIQSEIDTGTRD